MQKQTKALIEQAIQQGGLDLLSTEDLAHILLLLTGDAKSQQTWLPPHIHTVDRTTWLGAREIIVYNADKVSLQEALDSDGYGANVMVLEEAQFKSFFAKE